MKYRVWMIFPDQSMYQYGIYDDRDKANEIAMQIREERGVQTHVEVISI